MRKLLLALALILGSVGLASGQNITCPDRPSTDSSNACANTRFVKNNGGGGGSGSVAAGTAGQLAIYPSAGTSVSGVTISGDCTVAITGALTCTKTNGVAFGPAATASSASTNVNGQNCPLGGTCTISAAASLIVNSSTVTGGTSNGLFYNNGGTFGNLTTLNNGVLVTSSSGVPAISTTFPNGLAFGTPASLTLTNATGLPTSALTGTLAAAQEPAHTGDMTNSAGSLVTAVNSIGGKAVTLGGGFTTSGAFSLTFTLSANTSLVLPTSGTVTALGNTTTGTGSVVLATSPTLVTPNLGVPSFVTLTNATGLPLTTGVTGVLPIANGGTGQPSALAARGASGLIIDNLCTFGDTNFTPASTCRQLATTTTFTAPRTLTIPAAASVNPGQPLVFVDAAAAITATNTLTIARSSSDTINGAASQTLTAPTYGSGAILYSNGVNSWSYTPSGGSGGGSGTVTQVTAGGSMTASGGAVGGSITSAGTIDLANQTRGNLTLDRVNNSKLLGTVQRGIGAYTDGFADTSGINASTSSNYTLSTTSKTVSPSTPAGATMAGPATVGSSDGSNSGRTMRTVIAAAGLSSTPGSTTTQVNFQVGSGGQTLGAVYIGTSAGGGSFSGTPTPCLFSGASTIVVAANGTASCIAAYQVPASTAIVVSHYIGGAGYDTLNSNPTNWQGYYSPAGVNDPGVATASGYNAYNYSPDLVSVATVPPPNNITLASTPQTADGTVTTGRSSIILAAANAPTWGTNDFLEVSCNASAGTPTWNLATPIFLGLTQYGNLYEMPDTTCVTTGNSFGARYRTANNQARTIYSFSLAVH